MTRVNDSLPWLHQRMKGSGSSVPSAEGIKAAGWIGAACIACCGGPIVGFIVSASATTRAVMLTGLGGILVGGLVVVLALRQPEDTAGRHGSAYDVTDRRSDQVTRNPISARRIVTKSVQKLVTVAAALSWMLMLGSCSES